MEQYRIELAKKIDTLQIEGLNSAGIYFDPHQIRALKDISKFLKETQINTASILQAGGSGKTWEEIAILQASQSVKKGILNYPDILIVTENSIKSGVIEKLEQQNLDFCIWEDGKKPLDRSIIISSIQTLQREKSSKIKSILSPDVPLIIGDEADLYITLQRKELLNYFPRTIKLGFSATGKWTDGRNINTVWGETIHSYSLAQAIYENVVVKPKYQLIESSVSMDALPKTSGDYPIEELDRVLTEAEIYEGVVNAYEAITNGNVSAYPTIIFVPSVNLVRMTAGVFRKKYGRNIKLSWWTGEDTIRSRQYSDIKDFKDGKIDVLIVCEMGGRGMDLPNAKLLIDAYPTRSLTKIEQRHSRIMRRDRKANTKDECIILQIVPRTSHMKPKTFIDIFQHDEEKGTKKTLLNQDNNEINLVYEKLSKEQVERLHRELKINTENTSSYTLQEVTVCNEIVLGKYEESIEINDEIWGTAKYLSSLFGLSISSIRLAGKKHEIKMIPRPSTSNLMVLYNLLKLKKDLEHRIVKYRTQRKEDYLMINEIEYHNQETLAKTLDTTVSRISSLCKYYNLTFIECLCEETNRILKFYNKTEFEEKYMNSIAVLQKKGKDIFIEKNGTKYATARYISSKYSNLSVKSIGFENADRISMPAAISEGRKYTLYDLEFFEKREAFFKTLPKSDKNGIIKNYNGLNFINLEGIYQLLNGTKNRRDLHGKAKRNNILIIEGLNTARNQVVRFYEYNSICNLFGIPINNSNSPFLS